MKYAVLFITATTMLAADQVKTGNGTLEGTVDSATGVRMFKGVPFAEPPTGDLRWAPPQPPKNWSGVRKAVQFGPRCMQRPLFGDMNFRSSGMSEDCLYLNIWTPAKSASERLPVLVYIYGGGFQAGDGSEPRYDGESLATKGIVTVTVNYRLDIFGFFAHPELTRESPHHASGNYGLLDQSAAIKWVRANIAAFGGDPGKITIGGESAGSISVSALMASPLSKDLIAGAIGESGSILGALSPVPLGQAEEQGLKFENHVGAKSLAALRAMSSDELLHVLGEPGAPGRFPITVDGYFFPEPPKEIFAHGKQAHVPLLAGWNSEEMTGRALLSGTEPTTENYTNAVRKLYSNHADEVLKAYAPANNDDVMGAATALASDRFIAFSTWKWLDEAAKTGGQPVYRYYFERPRPPMRPEMGDAVPGLAGGVIRGNRGGRPAPPATGAVHSAEIEYALGNLSSNKVYAWTPDDYKISKVMEDYFADFIKTGNPNGPGLPKWPPMNGTGTVEVMHIGLQSQAEPEQHRDRYLLLDTLAQ